MPPAPQPFTTRPEIAGSFGVVASTHWLASQVGMGVLEKGGNAFDAAVAAGFMLQVVEPHMNGMGGDAVMLVHPVGEAMPRLICGQGVAPAGASIAHYKSEGLTLIPGTGHLAAVIPGAFDSWMLLLRDHGTMTLAEVLAPAIHYARDGYPLVAGAAGAIAGVAELFRTEWKSSGVHLPAQQHAARAGLVVRQHGPRRHLRAHPTRSDLAGADREKQIEAARAAYYKGFVAEAIEKFMATPVMDASGTRHRGVISAQDLAGWEATYEAPTTLRLSRLHRLQGRPVVARARAAAAPGVAQGLRRRVDGHDRARFRAHAGRGARSSPMPTATPGTATPNSSTCRWQGC